MQRPRDPDLPPAPPNGDEPAIALPRNHPLLPPCAIGAVPSGMLLDETPFLCGLLLWGGVGPSSVSGFTDGGLLQADEGLVEGRNRGARAYPEARLVKGQWTTEEDR